MRANELMIGDWVSYRNTPRKVVYINDRPLQELHNDEIGFTSHDDEWISACNAYPIPLTEEILKANGFEFGLTSEQECFCAMHASCGASAEKSWVKEDGGGEYCISWQDNNVYVSNLHDRYYQGKCEYVHELQHALRLCGLDELADNFKIE